MNVTAFQDAYLSRISTIPQSEEINLHVANALTFVIQNVFGQIANTFVFTLSTSGGPIEFWLHDTMSKLFASLGLIAVQLVVRDSKIRHLDVPGMRYCNLIMTDSFESLKNTNIAKYNRNSDSLEYYYIFLQTRDKLFEKEMEMIFKYCFDNYWLHCNIMVQNSKGEVLIYTYFPFKENNCFQTKPELINRFIGDRFKNDMMFPNKLRNLQGCPLKLSTWETPPFVINKTNKLFPNINVSGFEIFILITLSENMNFTLDVEWLGIETYEQNVSPDAEPLSKLKNFETNFTMGYFRHTAERDLIATPTYVTYYIPLAAVILRKEAHHKSIGILTFPFDKTTWILILVVYTIIGIFNIFQNKGKACGIFKIFEIILGIPLNNVPKWTSTRISFMTTILSSFILRSVYQSLLFHIFRTNFYQAAPLTLKGLVEDGYKAVSTELTERFLLFVPQIKDKTLPLIVINNTNEMYPLRYLELYRNESLVAISIIEFAVRYVYEEMSNGGALQVLSMNVKDQQICFYLPKHSYLSEIFDLSIIRLHQSGLLIKWREWTNYQYPVSQGDSSTAYKHTLMVNLNQLNGFLLFIIILHIISIVFFVLELLSKNFKWLQQVF